MILWPRSSSTELFSTALLSAYSCQVHLLQKESPEVRPITADSIPLLPVRILETFGSFVRQPLDRQLSSLTLTFLCQLVWILQVLVAVVVPEWNTGPYQIPKLSVDHLSDINTSILERFVQIQYYVIAVATFVFSFLSFTLTILMGVIFCRRFSFFS